MSVKIVGSSKYNLSCMRYYIVIAMCRAQLVNNLVILSDIK